MKLDKGIFSVYKPKGPTSFDIVEKIKKLTGEKRVGHAGTLDPLAEGVLIVGIGRENTKKLQGIVEKEKEYLTTIKLGEKSSTDDNGGEKTSVFVKSIPEKNQIDNILSDFSGEIEQVPPRFSAVKVKGERAYKLAREGRDFKLKPRKVFIKEIELIDYKYPFLELRIVTGKGFYVRSLARDIGEKLNTGGYVFWLKRTRVGNFKIEDSLSLDELKELYLK